MGGKYELQIRKKEATNQTQKEGSNGYHVVK